MSRQLTILIANWTWYPSGGDWTYVDNLRKFYESKGHKVIPFSMHHERNFPSEYAEYFISNINYQELNRNKNLTNSFKAVKSTIYSTEAKNQLAKLLDKYKVDVAHLNNVHHYLTPASIVPELKKRSIPVIWTLHDYVILCPNTTFISKEQVCERCKTGKFYHCTLRKCKKNSLFASMASSLESYMNNWMNPYKHVDYFICPSLFIKNKFEAFGFKSDKLKQVYNLFDIDSVQMKDMTRPDNHEKPYILYIGNILKVKGIFTLVKAVKNENIDLYIAGDGEHFEQLKQLIQQEGIANVYLLGKKPKEELFRYVKHSKFVVVPSEWYENLPYSLVEALLLSKPVLGANIGGIPELVINDHTGFLFEPGNVEDLSNRIRYMLSDAVNLEQLGDNAKKHAACMVNFSNFEKGMNPIFQSLNLPL
jgi:glycosyltransferase involved in cell wall biosynthesis